MDMGADYFGTSRYWLSVLGQISESEIRNGLRVSRQIGGHMLFPRNIQSPETGAYIW